MKPKADFDPMFEVGGRRRSGAIRWIGGALALAALGGMTLRAGPIPAQRPGARPQPRAPMVRGPAPNPRAGAARPADRFVIEAPGDIDPRMVIMAPADLDVEMVFNPETGRRGTGPFGPPTSPTPYSPTPIPAPAVPVPGPGR